MYNNSGVLKPSTTETIGFQFALFIDLKKYIYFWDLGITQI